MHFYITFAHNIIIIHLLQHFYHARLGNQNELFPFDASRNNCKFVFEFFFNALIFHSFWIFCEWFVAELGTKGLG